MSARVKLLVLVLPLCLVLFPAALVAFVIRAAAWPFARLQLFCTRVLHKLVDSARLELRAAERPEGVPSMPLTKAQHEATRALH